MKKFIQEHVIYQLNRKEINTAIRRMINNTKIEGSMNIGITTSEAKIEFLVDADTNKVMGVEVINIYNKDK